MLKNLQSWIAVLVVAGDDKAAITAAKELPTWFPHQNEGAFLAGSALSAGMSALDRDTSLTEKERSRRLNELGAEAVALFQKNPPTAAQHVRDMKESPLFELLRRRDDFNMLLKNLER